MPPGAPAPAVSRGGRGGPGPGRRTGRLPDRPPAPGDPGRRPAPRGVPGRRHGVTNNPSHAPGLWRWPRLAAPAAAQHAHAPESGTGRWPAWRPPPRRAPPGAPRPSLPPGRRNGFASGHFRRVWGEVERGERSELRWGKGTGGGRGVGRDGFTSSSSPNHPIPPNSVQLSASGDEVQKVQTKLRFNEQLLLLLLKRRRLLSATPPPDRPWGATGLSGGMWVPIGDFADRPVPRGRPPP